MPSKRKRTSAKVTSPAKKTKGKKAEETPEYSEPENAELEEKLRMVDEILTPKIKIIDFSSDED